MMMGLYVDVPFDRNNNNLKFVTLIWENPVYGKRFGTDR